ncbi:acyl-CoA dehydrogenase family protein [Rhodopila sp.]|jgi:acyl-CoA dehydrogenase|uniref:acyl-CoA dehydrogenase family protein n=1 Tax=Rhodopila sp. TaxID=2480087 RepID=UPI002CAD2F22|nr:acyl-CoA dehydrogenase family protein [Rhodopila sp.]HVZ09681.1 acyl-CoA dehydrogenase family protein [Rhodopila sp.]
MAMRDETRMLLESMTRLFEDKSTKQVVDAAETGVFAADLWQAVAETGVPLAALPEASGGADAEWSDLFAVLRVAGRFSAPIPLAETMLAGWVAAGAGLEVADGPMTVGPVRPGETLTLAQDGNGWRLSGTASRLPYASHAARTVLIADGPDGEMAVALDGTGEARVTAGRNIANEPRDTLAFDGVRIAADAAAPLNAGVSKAALYRRGALARATMMSGALERALDLAVTYAQERVQFGRPISKFQAVQQNLAVLAGQTAAAVAAANLGIEALGKGDPARETFLIAVAKARVGEAATLAAEIAHQVHGAIGFTKEYALQLSTRRLWSWREEFGPDPEWAVQVGKAACANGADGLWAMLTAV